MDKTEYFKLSHISLFNTLVNLREKFDFFDLLCRLGVLDSSNFYIQKLMKVSVRFFVLYFKNHNDDDEFLEMINLGEKFELILYDFYKSLQITALRKE